MTKTQNQCMKILDHLYHNDGITQAEAAELYGVWRLSARIWDLRHLGFFIEDVTEKGKNRDGKPCSWVRYRIPEEIRKKSMEWEETHGHTK